MSKKETAPRCLICGEPKRPGTFTIGKEVIRIWMCGTLQMDHDEILAHEVDDDIEWDNENEEEILWEDV